MDEKTIEHALVELIKKAETEIPKDVIVALKQAAAKEKGVAKLQIETILKNIEQAKKTQRPLCQDTGIQTFYVSVGTFYPLIGKLKGWILYAVKKATDELLLRPNTVDPITGKNHTDNVGDHVPIINWDFQEGSDVIVTALPKGSGSENMSALCMLNPSAGMEGMKKCVVDTVIKAAGNPCPPTVVGVGVGGSADLSLKLGKLALLRPVGKRHPDSKVAKIEQDLITQINKTGIGPMGLGGKTTVLDVHVETALRHPASFPVGVVIQCWADRRATLMIHANGRWEFQ